MFFYLLEFNIEKLILFQIYYGLLEVYFNLNEYGRFVDVGNEYFKL